MRGGRRIPDYGRRVVIVCDLPGLICNDCGNHYMMIVPLLLDAGMFIPCVQGYILNVICSSADSAGNTPP